MNKILLICFLFLCVFRVGAADYYWIGGGGNWSDLSHWRLDSPTGSIPSIVPSAGDNVFFGAYSGFGTTTTARTVLLDANAYCNNMTWEIDVPNSPIMARAGSNTLFVYGNLVLAPTVTYDNVVNVEFTGSDPATLTTNGEINSILNLTVNKPGSGLTLVDDLIYTGTTSNNSYGLTLTAGYLNASGRNVDVYSFWSQNDNPRHLEITSGRLKVLRNFYFRGANKTIASSGSYVQAGIRLVTDGGEFDQVEAMSDSPNNDLFSIYNTTFKKLTFSHTSPSSNARIHGNNVVDSLIFLGAGVVREASNSIRYLSIAGMGTIGGSGNMIQYAEIGGALDIITTGQIIDTLYTAPNKNILITGNTTINNVFKAGGAPCDAFTEVTGVSGGTLHFADGAVADIDNVLLTNISATGSIAPITVTGIDNGGNSGFVINAPTGSGTTLYWVGGAGDWNDRAHWSSSSGGPGGACIPFIGDDVVFDSNSGLNAGEVVTSSGNAYCHNMTWAADITGNPEFLVGSGFSVRVYGSVVLNPNVTMNAILDMKGGEAVTLTTNGSVNGTNQILISKDAADALAGGVTLLDDWLNPSASILLNRGHLDIAGRVVDIGSFISNVVSGRHVDMQGANVTVDRWEYRGSYKTLDASGSHLTINTVIYMVGDMLQYDVVDVTTESENPDSFRITETGFGHLMFSNSSLSTVARIGANNDIEKLEFMGQGMIRSGGNVIDSLITAENRNFWLYEGSNTIDSYFKATHPSCSGLGEIRSGGATATLIFGADTEVLIDNVYMENIAATGGGGSLTLPIAFNGVDAGGNSGWEINTATGGARYWVGGGGDWNDASHWSTSSGGSGGACIPTATDDVYFDGNSGFGTTPTSRTVTISSGNAYFRNMSWAGVQNNPVWNMSGTWKVESWGNSITLEPNSVLNQTLGLMGPEHMVLYGNTTGALNLEVRKPGGSLTFADDYNNANTRVYLFDGNLLATGKTLGLYMITNEGRDNAIHVDISNATLNLSSWWQFYGTANNRSLNAENSVINTTAVQIDGFEYHEMNVSGTASTHAALNGVVMDQLTFTNTDINNNIGINGSNNHLGQVEYKGSGRIYGTDNEIGTLIFAPGYVYTFNAGTNTTITGAWYGSGTPCRLTEIVSGSSTANATVTKASGLVDLDYIRLSRMTATGGASFSAREHSIDLGGNVGWDIAPYDGAAPIYGLGPDISLNERQFPYNLNTDGFFGHPESQYEWSRNGTVIGTENILTVTEPGTYAVSVTFPDGCSVDDEILITREEADVQTVKAIAGPVRTTYAPGEEVVYTITVTNNGPYTALDVGISDTAPEGTSITAWTATVGEGDVDLPNESGSGDLDETLEELPVGAVVVYELTLSTGSGMETDLINTVVVSSITPDPEPGCETCTVTLNAAPVADLSVTKTLTDVAQTGYVPGDVVGYTITAGNEGPSDARNVRIEDMAPEGTSIATWTASVGEGTVSLPNVSGSGNLDETLTVLPAGATVIYEITVQTPVDFRDDLINTAGISSDTEDPDEENNTATTLGLPSVPDVPISDGNLEACAEDPVQTLTASATVQDGAELVWYDAPTAGNTVVDPSLDTVGTMTYYAEAIKDGLSSETRTGVTLTILALPTVMITDPEVVCLPGTVDLTRAEVTAGSDVGLIFTYYTDAAGTNQLPNPEAVSQSGTYYIAGTHPSTGCRTVMPVSARFVNRPEVSVTHPSCVVGTGSIEVTDPIGSGFEYSINGVDYQAGTEFLGLAPGATYAVTSRHTDLPGCVSEPLEVTISNNPVTETPQVIQPDCWENRGSIVFMDNPGYEYSIDNGASYHSSPNFTELAGGVYLARVRQPSTGCEAEAVEVTVDEEIVLPDAPLSNGNQEVCSTDSSLPLMATVTVPEGTTVIWYDAASDGNVVDDPIWSQIGSMTYYAEASNGGCASPARTPVTLTIMAAPLLDPVEDVESCEGYVLPVITGSNLSGNEAYYTGQGGTGNRFMAGEVVTDPGTTILYIYDVLGNGCMGETSFGLTINEVLPGSIGPDQTVRFNEVPELIRSEETGGGTGSMEYRWEVSEDGISWTLIVGANDESYQPGALVTTSHYRRITLATMPGGTICESGPTDEVTITVMEIDGPLANDDIVSTPTHTPIAFNPLANDVEGDFPIDPASVKFIDPGTGEEVVFLDIMGEGTWSVDPDTGEVTFAPDAGFNGETTPIGYVMYDEAGMESNPALLIVRIAAVPEAENDTTFTVSVSGGYAGNVLDNDTFGGNPATSNNVTITFNDPEQSGITVDERGDVYVPIGIGPGVYTLSYTICNADYPGTCDTATVVITVEIEGVVVHNVISPNGDGINDHLTIEGIGSYPDNVLEIYNRWGIQVFKAEGYSNSGKVFDGTSDARMTMKKSNGMPAGTYYYVLRFSMDGEIQSKMGWLYIQNNN